MGQSFGSDCGRGSQMTLRTGGYFSFKVPKAERNWVIYEQCKILKYDTEGFRSKSRPGDTTAIHLNACASRRLDGLATHKTTRTTAGTDKETLKDNLASVPRSKSMVSPNLIFWGPTVDSFSPAEVEAPPQVHFETPNLNWEIPDASNKVVFKELGRGSMDKRSNTFIILLHGMLLLFALAFIGCVTGLKWSKAAVLRERHGRKQSARHRARKSATASCEKMTSKMDFQRWPRVLSTGLLLCLNAALLIPVEAGLDLWYRIIDRVEPCFSYIPEFKLFCMNCSTLRWKSQGYGANTYITLGANETFDGNHQPTNDGSIIDLSGIDEFQGLFVVNETEVKTFDEAPYIKNVHVRNGTVAQFGGYLARKEQKFVIIDSCSSTGDISEDSGGICGYRCGHGNGRIEISNSCSRGRMMVNRAGGITGPEVGANGGMAKITKCHSTGNMEGTSSGGICGQGADRDHGEVCITQSYSTGNIIPASSYSGGIVGPQAGIFNGYVDIQQCYGTGQLAALGSGGISGALAADQGGEVRITDCYTRGEIAGTGHNAAGIMGRRTGGCCSVSSSTAYGDIYINNTYASGKVNPPAAGGIIGTIYSNFREHTVHVQYSVYNDNEELKIVGEDSGNYLEETDNSNELADIQGRLYHYEGVQQWSNDTWVIIGTNSLPIFWYQVPSPRPTPSSTSTASVSPTATSTGTATASKTTTPTPSLTRTATSSRTETPTQSLTITATVSATETPTATLTRSATSSSSFSSTRTASPTRTSLPSSSPIPTSTPTAARSNSPRVLTAMKTLPVQRPPRSVRQR